MRKTVTENDLSDFVFMGVRFSERLDHFLTGNVDAKLLLNSPGIYKDQNNSQILRNTYWTVFTHNIEIRQFCRILYSKREMLVNYDE